MREILWIGRCPECHVCWEVESKDNPVMEEHDRGSSWPREEINAYHDLQEHYSKRAFLALVDPIGMNFDGIIQCIYAARQSYNQSRIPCRGVGKLSSIPVFDNDDREASIKAYEENREFFSLALSG